MAGIYFHIPYCRQACVYCNFHFSTGMASRQPMLDAMLRETEIRRSYLNDETVETIYFGGGTPSLLDADELKQLLQAAYTYYNIGMDPEVTLEANPDDLTREKLKAIHDLGFNRLSIGIQSFQDADLKRLRRVHNASQAIDAVRTAQETGIRNITIDLIYGIPGQPDEDWLQNLETLRKLDIPHFSAYALTVEPRTALDHEIRKGKSAPVDEEQTERHFRLLQEWCIDNGYRAYEISNYARPGWESKHNTAYWFGKPYLGIGPSAHSFNGRSRQWNISNNALYIKGITEGKEGSWYEMETLSPAQACNEYLMTRLRTCWGADLTELQALYGRSYREAVEKEARPHVLAGRLVREGEKLYLATHARLLADGIIADLFID